MLVSETALRFIRQRSKGYKIAYLLVAALILIFELLIYAVSEPIDGNSLLLLSVLLISLAGAPWLGVCGDAVYIILYMVGAVLPVAQHLSFPILGIMLIAASWIIDRYSVSAGILILGAEIVTAWGRAQIASTVVGAVMAFICAFGFGVSLRKTIDKERSAQQKLEAAEEESQKAIASVQAELAAQLHDTVAKDLAQMTILLENLAISHPAISGDLTAVANIARRASRRIHPMIMDLAAVSESPTLVRAVKEAEVMLRSKNIVLSVEMNSDIDSMLSRKALVNSSLFLNEAAINILKYGQKDSVASLFVEILDRDVTLMMVNKIAVQGVITELSGGYGLSKMRSRIESDGGKISFAAADGQWVINASIPNIKGENNE